jgi:uncharacterized protein
MEMVLYYPQKSNYLSVIKSDKLDEVDDWIVDHAFQGDSVISAGIPLTSKCLEKRAVVLGYTGRDFTVDNI